MIKKIFKCTMPMSSHKLKNLKSKYQFQSMAITLNPRFTKTHMILTNYVHHK